MIEEEISVVIDYGNKLKVKKKIKKIYLNNK